MTPLRLVGHVLLWTGFFAGSFLAVQNAEVAGDKWATVKWPWYAAALGIGICGVVVLRMTQRQATTHAHKLEDDMATIDEQILRTTKEIVVKFIESGRISPSSFHDTFKDIYHTVEKTTRDSMKASGRADKKE